MFRSLLLVMLDGSGVIADQQRVRYSIHKYGRNRSRNIGKGSIDSLPQTKLLHGRAPSCITQRNSIISSATVTFVQKRRRNKSVPVSKRVIRCLHDPANVQQTSALVRVFWIHLPEVCWTFAGSSKHPISLRSFNWPVTTCQTRMITTRK